MDGATWLDLRRLGIRTIRLTDEFKPDKELALEFPPRRRRTALWHDLAVPLPRAASRRLHLAIQGTACLRRQVCAGHERPHPGKALRPTARPARQDPAGEPVEREALLVAIERYELSLGENAYLAYFERHLRPEHRVMGELTPWYSLTPASGFRFIRAFLVKERLTPKVIFVMRDPV